MILTTAENNTSTNHRGAISARPRERHPRFATVPGVQHVLVATDFSPVGNAAIPHALSLLHAGGVLTLMHVTPLAPVIRAYSLGVEAAEQRRFAEEAREIAVELHALVPAAAAERGVVTGVNVAVAEDIGVAIAAAALERRVDIICLGTSGRTDLSRAMLGSVTRTVMAKTRQPVFLIPSTRGERVPAAR